jgi:hypothetical protein
VVAKKYGRSRREGASRKIRMKQWVEAEYEKRKLEVEDADIDPYACVGDIVIALYQLELFARHMGQVDGRVSKGHQLDWMEGRVSCVGSTRCDIMWRCSTEHKS